MTTISIRQWPIYFPDKFGDTSIFRKSSSCGSTSIECPPSDIAWGEEWALWLDRPPIARWCTVHWQKLSASDKKESLRDVMR